MVDEPSVLDYFKSIFTFSRGRIPRIQVENFVDGTKTNSEAVIEASQDFGFTVERITSHLIAANPNLFPRSSQSQFPGYPSLF
jgi:hypothetical protein